MKPGKSWQNNLPALFSVLLLLILNLTKHLVQLRDQIFHILNAHRHTQSCVRQSVLFLNFLWNIRMGLRSQISQKRLRHSPGMPRPFPDGCILFQSLFP